MTKITYNTKNAYFEDFELEDIFVFYCHLLHDFELEATAYLFLVSAFEYRAVVDLSETRCGTAHRCVGTGMSSLLLLACL